MRILMYIHGLSSGGAERVFALLASGLARQGAEVTLVVDRIAIENAAYLDAAVDVVALEKSHAGAVVALARMLSGGRYDVSLSAIGASNLKHAAAAVLAGRGGRAVLSCHGFFDVERQRLSRLGNALTPLTSRLTGATVCVSESLKRFVAAKARGAAGKVCRIYNPVELSKDPPPTRDMLLARPRTILAVGRLHEAKRFGVLVEAVAQLRDPSANLVIVGDGPERPALESLVASLGLERQVRLAGHVDDPSGHYRAARVFSLPSRSESFGNVIVEALSFGLPVVATRCGGPEEILAEGRYGTLVPVDDAETLAVALRTLLDEPGDPAPRVRRASEFDLDTCVGHYRELFERLAG